MGGGSLWGPEWDDLRGAMEKASSHPQEFLVTRWQRWMPPEPLVGRGG